VIREGGSEDHQQVGLVHEVARDRRAAAAEHTTPQRVRVGDLALRLEGREHRAGQPLGERGDLVHRVPGSVPHDEHGSLGLSESIERLVEYVGGWCDLGGRDTTLGPSRFAPLRGQGLDLVGKDDVRDAPVEVRVLAGQRGQLGGVARVEQRLRPLRDLAVRRLEVDLLEGASAENLDVDLARQCQHRGAVDVRVPQSGQHVRRAGARDGEASRGASGELAVRGSREGPATLVANSDVGEVSRLFANAEGVGEPEVGVSDHPEDPLHVPGDERLDEDVAHRTDTLALRGESDVHAVLADLDGEGLDAVVEARRLAVERVVVPAVPGTPEQAVLDRSLAQRAALVGAAVVEGSVLVAHARHADGVVLAGDRLHPPVPEFVAVERLQPAAFIGVGAGGFGHGAARWRGTGSSGQSLPVDP